MAKKNIPALEAPKETEKPSQAAKSETNVETVVESKKKNSVWKSRGPGSAYSNKY